MKINLGSISFNSKLESGVGTPGWQTELGKGAGYLIKVDGIENLLVGMLNNFIDSSKVEHNFRGNKDIILSACFEKVFVNGQKIKKPFILCLIEEHTTSHDGRKSLKYNDALVYRKSDKNLIANSEFYSEVQDLFGATSSWFVNSFKVVNYEEIHLEGIYVADKPQTYKDSKARKAHWLNFLDEVENEHLTKYAISRDEHSKIEEPISLKVPRNKIIYGAPGTGKSYELREQGAANGFLDHNILRVTFHPNYSYQQFVGSYKPSPIYRNILEEGAVLYGSDKTTELGDNYRKEPLIDYTFVPGPFLKILIKAILNPDNNYLLIIEEINRAPVSSVFGDVFQLLDRSESGESEYSISFNEEAQSFLRSNGIAQSEIKIPENFFIWATMNSADQGVMPLDSAFKRRWNFEYLPLDKKQDVIKDRNITFQGEKLNWNKFRTQINKELIRIGVAEDKLIGPFFMSLNELSDENTIKNKLLLYLRDDVVRHYPESLFKHKTYSEIITKYDSKEQIFVNVELSAEIGSLYGQEE